MSTAKCANTITHFRLQVQYCNTVPSSKAYTAVEVELAGQIFRLKGIGIGLPIIRLIGKDMIAHGI
jgi:hypothetical protein